MGDWFHLELADVWWYWPDNSGKVILKIAREEYAVTENSTTVAGPFASLEAAQAAYLILIGV